MTFSTTDERYKTLCATHTITSLPLNHMNNTARILLTIGAAIFLFMQLYFLFSGNFDDYLYSGNLFLYASLILFITPITIFGFLWATIGHTEKGKKAAILLAFASPIIIGPSFGLWVGHHEKESYAKYGVKTWGIVDQAYYSKGYRIRYYFYIDGIQISALANNPLRHEVGDTVEVIYNSKYLDQYTTIENL